MMVRGKLSKTLRMQRLEFKGIIASYPDKNWSLRMLQKCQNCSTEQVSQSFVFHEYPGRDCMLP